MNRANDEIKTRRKFLKMVSASPLLAGPGFLAGSFSSLLAAGEATDKKFIGARFPGAKRRCNYFSGPGLRCDGF